MAKITEVSPFAPKNLPRMPTVDGVRFAAAEAGIKYRGRKDLMLAILDEGTVAAGTLTQSKTCSAAVLWCREQLRHGRARALVVNSGNANAFTGRRGSDAVEITARAAADAVGCDPADVYIASTGVIGEPMDTSSFAATLAALVPASTPDNWQDASSAIMTTDTFPKLAAASAAVGDATVNVAGFAKGSGMIAPDMATMLAFVFTDAAVEQSLLQSMTSQSVDKTFNCITVDSDTSTSDTVIVFATGKATNAKKITDPKSPEAVAFRDALHTVLHELALAIVKDGEGLSKFVTINVTGAENDRAAHRIGMSVANSPLLKTAIAGEDPNWGRVVMAVGKAGEAADRDKLMIRFGPNLVAENGLRADSYTEKTGADYMKGREIEISIDVGIADGKATVWTCDLTHGYISINADYRS
jgi:glutamate N-acetyltransferase / amino-acid N-acetyltransferase